MDRKELKEVCMMRVGRSVSSESSSLMGLAAMVESVEVSKRVLERVVFRWL